jgi:hypothetical protein
MRVEAISSDTSRAQAAQAIRSAPPTQPAQKPATAPAKPKDADGDTDGDMGRKGGLVDIGA